LRLPNTVDEDFFLAGPGVERQDLRASLGVQDRVVLLCVAELSDRKGIRDLLAAISRLSDQHRQRALFLFAGDGPLRGDLEAARDHYPIRLLGHVDRTTVRRWLYAADLFLLPSKIDPNPLSAIEAAFCGLPLVLSERAGNVTELVDGGESGWPLPVSDPEVMAARLEEVIATPEERRRDMGVNARRVAREKFSRRDISKNFVDELVRCFPPK
jgi:glycosyltransferase involved in cell wall biosynthesis